MDTAVSVSEHLLHLLIDIYSLEQQALAQMREAPDIAGDEGLVRHFREHLTETERQAEMVERRLEAAGGSPSTVKDAVMRLGGKGFLLFARAQPDTPGKLAAHAYSYEALEMAAYELLEMLARRADDDETARVAATIREQERAMRDRIASDFDGAVDASLDELQKEASETIPTYLADAHAIESQSIQLLKKGTEIAGDPTLARLYEAHRGESAEHAGMIEERLEALGENSSAVKDAALRTGAVNWGLFFQALEDTPAKLAAFVYAVEHLEIAGYELLRRVAERAGDTETAALAAAILSDERAMAERVWEAFDRALEASLAE